MTLESPIETLIRLKEDTRAGLRRLGIVSVRDLLYHFPTRYADASIFTSIAGLIEGETATIRGTVKKIVTKKSWKTKVPMSEGIIEDMSGTMTVVWFNQPYLAKMIRTGSIVELTGKVSVYKDQPALVNPTAREERIMPIDSHDSLFGSPDSTQGGVLTPVYAETRDVSSLWFSHTITRALFALGDIPDHIPSNLLEQYSLPSLKTALIWIHSPKTHNDAMIARKRFAYDEIFSINVARAQERNRVKSQRAYSIDMSTIDMDYFLQRFSFPLTSAQQSSIAQILDDLQKEVPMSRLLEGDVGSGKTAVAAVATYATVMNRPSINKKGAMEKQTFGNLQVAYMAPTELLATQHFESFIELFADTGISIALITGSGCRKYPSKVASTIPRKGAAQGEALAKSWTTISRAQLSKWIANGEIPVVIGTHTLIQKSLTFKHLALAIIDEQHRFGLKQRQGLAKKDTHFPHLLSMTATPIPRTLALTLYGDLDLSILDVLPAGRKKIATTLATVDKRDMMYETIRTILKEGRQLYVICPRIGDPDPDKAKAIQAKSVTTEAVRLQKDVFPEFRIGVLHSKMTKGKKEEAMKSFVQHETDMLVATSVVEVGVNVPNATLIIIEGAERFGLAQLHQLRGRVARSSYQAHCYLFADAKTERTLERMNYFLKAEDGFALAEYDLAMRGGGELTGAHQWGITDIGMEALRNIKLVEAARQSAQALVASDPTLADHPLLVDIVSKYEMMHFE